ncbi:hypothetical protein [Nocardia brasiliensis]|uniref:hypothetical protein n=1 Tax=Nocardia brasiliensis TaxID=37326 RepID=UPI0024564FC8|nr:hypothetical protein [Nocardia brasiliensis]
MSSMHFVNLTRGKFCPHIVGLDVHYCRIQSTSCEQKRWEDVIRDAGPDLLMAMATGKRIIVHDVSERNRETRAMWQGLAFLKRAAETVWGLEHTPIAGRGGLSMEHYFDDEIRRLDLSPRKVLKHYRQHLATSRIHVVSCWRTTHHHSMPVRRLEAA